MYQPLPEGFRHVAWQDLDALESALDPSVSVVLLEPVQGEGGVNPAHTEYFAGVRRLCDEGGVLFMVDEIQTGLGRTGEWFGFQHFGVQPDVVTMAKALGNGVPIGACWAKADVAAAFVPGDHATTFGGQPRRPRPPQGARGDGAGGRPRPGWDAGKRLADGLPDLPHVTGVRGLGLLLAGEVSDRDGREVAGAVLDAGLVVNGISPTALRFAPSLLVDEAEIDEALAILEGILA